MIKCKFKLKVKLFLLIGINNWVSPLSCKHQSREKNRNQMRVYEHVPFNEKKIVDR